MEAVGARWGQPAGVARPAARQAAGGSSAALRPFGWPAAGHATGGCHGC